MRRLVLVSVAPLANIERYKQRMGWTIPWFSSAGGDFNVNFGLSRKTGETFGLTAFFRDGDAVDRNDHTNGPGVEMLGSARSFLDLTVLGRQETWEDSPKGWPQTPPV